MEYVEVARATSERGDVVLRARRDPDAPDGTPTFLELRVNGVFVMDTCETSSEELMARLALQHVADPRVVLVGGLGLGYTVHAVLSDHRVEHVQVAELEDALVGWFRNGTIPHGRPYLADGRLSVSVADVRQVVSEAAAGSFDLILLDVDNGPDFLVHEENAALYQAPFLQLVRAALRPRGVVAVWSSSASPRLAGTLREVFGESRGEAHPVTLQGHEESYWLYSATKTPEADDPDEGER